ncbi:hypothetical protein Cma02nite_07580 [Cellulomonas marina]|uniref:Formate/nitrite transporter n=1 Tax=Cellulomonas marina TaxID=988821 RepID=A0A1I0Z0J7_9CELL|nr:hypothetical protein Cma02nite_07580 [Cellulomonas marina]SFB19145.1 Formate/nitrite transporter [Cellulomonas marina]
MTLVLNLVGGWVMTWLIVHALPTVRATAFEAGEHIGTAPLDLTSFSSAVLAGAVITLMTRMQHATESIGVKVVPAILFGALLAGAQLFHSVLDSLLMFAALQVGADFGYLDWLARLGWLVLGNVLGGVVLVTAIRLLRVQHRVVQERRDPVEGA